MTTAKSKFHYNKYNVFSYIKNKTKKLLLRRPGWSPVFLQVHLLSIRRFPPEVSSNNVDDLLHTLPSGVFCFCHRTLDNRCQGDSRVVAPEASQNMLHYHPAQLAALGFEAGPKGLIQAPESLCGRVQHRAGISNRGW